MSAPLPPLVTTIIPTFRRPQLLRRAIESVLQQDHPAFQVCVYDNHSQDETAAVVAELARRDPRVRYFCHERNIGGLANFQYGMARIDTPYFTFLSDDDYLLPGFFSAALPALEREADAIFWAGLTLRIDDEGKFFDARVDAWAREGVFAPPEGVRALLKGNAPCWAGTVFRRHAIDEIGLLDENVGGPADLDYMLRAAARHPYIVSKLPVAVFTMHAASISSTAPLSTFWPGWLKMIENIGREPGLSPEARTEIVEALHADASRMLFRRGAAALEKGNLEFARRCAQELQRHYRMFARAALLRSLAFACAFVPGMQWLYARCYRAAERRIIRQREALRVKYAGFLRAG
jgi:glycosyltransferase involved in cell wall biosynthesis